MPEQEVTVRLTFENMPLIMDVIRAAVDVCEARSAGADLYEASDEVDRLEQALLNLGAPVKNYRVFSPESDN
jgi:hypothetical protein